MYDLIWAVNQLLASLTHGAKNKPMNKTQIVIFYLFFEGTCDGAFAADAPTKAMWRTLHYSGFETRFGPGTQVPGSDIKTHLESRFCLQVMLKKTQSD